METRGTLKSRASKDDMEMYFSGRGTAMGHSWGTLQTLTQDGLRLRDFVAALVVYDRKGSGKWKEVVNIHNIHNPYHYWTLRYTPTIIIIIICQSQALLLRSLTILGSCHHPSPTLELYPFYPLINVIQIWIVFLNIVTLYG